MKSGSSLAQTHPISRGQVLHYSGEVSRIFSDRLQTHGSQLLQRPEADQSPPVFIQHRDVRFREDEGRTRERTLGNNLSRLRRFAVTLLKRHPIKDSLRGKMVRSLMNTDFLTQVLTGKYD